MVMDTIRVPEWEEGTEDLSINLKYLEFLYTENFERTKHQHDYIDVIIWGLSFTNMVLL